MCCKTHGVEDAVNVERRVHSDRLVKDHVPNVTSTVILGRRSGQGKRPVWWEGDEFVNVAGIVAFYGSGIKLGCEVLTTFDIAMGYVIEMERN